MLSSQLGCYSPMDKALDSLVRVHLLENRPDLENKIEETIQTIFTEGELSEKERAIISPSIKKLRFCSAVRSEESSSSDFGCSNIKQVLSEVAATILLLRIAQIMNKPCEDPASLLLEYASKGYNTFIVLKYINYFDLDEDSKFALSKICIENGNGIGVAANFDKIGIESENKRFLLAKKFIKLCPRYCSINDKLKYFNKFGIENEEMQIDLAKKLINQGLTNTLALFQKFDNLGFRSEKVRFHLALYAAKDIGTLSMMISQSLFFEDLKTANLAFFKMAPNVKTENSSAGENVQKKFQSALTILEQKAHSLNQGLKREQAFQTCLRILYITIIAKEMKEEDKLDIINFLDKALNIRNKQSSSFVIEAIIAYIESEKIRNNYKELPKVNYLLCIGVSLAKLSLEVEEHEFRGNVKQVKFLCKQKYNLKNRKTNLELQFLHIIEHFESISADPTLKWMYITQNLCSLAQDRSSKALQDALFSLENLFQFQYLSEDYETNNDRLRELLGYTPEELVTCSIQVVANSLFSEEKMERLGGVALFNEKYRQLVAQEKERFPFAIETYIRGIRKSEYSYLQPFMEEILVHILNGSFADFRYDDTRSLHLTKLKKEHSDIWNKWKTSIFMRNLEIADSGEGSSSSSQKLSEEEESRRWLEEKLIRDKHVGNLEEYPQLQAFLEAKEVEKLETKQIDTQLAEICKQLCEEEVNRSRTIDLFEQLLEVVKSDEQGAFLQWQRDIEDQITLLRQSGQLNLENPEITVTHDWLDLLLSGTEIPGSCQHLQGQQELNRCLPAYMSDGKIQMIAVKNKKGKIVARAIIKLLFKADGKPALFFERVYQWAPKGTYDNILLKTALEKAKEVGVELYEYDSDLQNPSQITLHSDGSTELHEYEDGGVGVSGGRYHVLARRIHGP